MQAGVRSFQIGDELPGVTRIITQDRINDYAAASGDHNPLHTDPTFAAGTQFGGTIAHGMLVLAYISEMLTAAFGKAWPASGHLKVRLRAPGRPGDSVTASGRVIRVDGPLTVCEVECRNPAGELLISGEASVTV